MDVERPLLQAFLLFLSPAIASAEVGGGERVVGRKECPIQGTQETPAPLRSRPEIQGSPYPLQFVRNSTETEKEREAREETKSQEMGSV